MDDLVGRWSEDWIVRGSKCLVSTSSDTERFKSRIMEQSTLSPFSISILILAIISTSWLSAQLDSDPILTYRFSVESELDSRHAKELVRFFSQTEAEKCYYIQEADCFKWSTPERVDHEELSLRLAVLGYELSAKVLRSDGLYLTAESSALQRTTAP